MKDSAPQSPEWPEANPETEATIGRFVVSWSVLENEMIDPRLHMNRLHLSERQPLARRQPVEKITDGARIGAPRVVIADAAREVVEESAFGAGA